jgi:hypothetical protein
MNRGAAISLAAAVLLACCTGEATALKHRERSSWMANVGIGVNRGRFEDVDDAMREYSNGAAPQIRFGRMIGSRLMVSANYQGWVVEFDQLDDRKITDAKIRRSLQNLTLGLTFFPGSSESWTGGLFVRGGGGMGWAGTSIVPVHEGEAQEHGERTDDWGTAWFGEAGYEFWISDTSTIGLLGNYTYFDIGGDLVTSGWTSGFSVNLSLYF